MEFLAQTQAVAIKKINTYSNPLSGQTKNRAEKTTIAFPAIRDSELQDEW